MFELFCHLLLLLLSPFLLMGAMTLCCMPLFLVSVVLDGMSMYKCGKTGHTPGTHSAIPQPYYPYGTLLSSVSCTKCGKVLDEAQVIYAIGSDQGDVYWDKQKNKWGVKG